jgi:hypothetical protein
LREFDKILLAMIYFDCPNVTSLNTKKYLHGLGQEATRVNGNQTSSFGKAASKSSQQFLSRRSISPPARPVSVNGGGQSFFLQISSDYDFK